MKQRILYLDLLRAWAIPCVVLLHCLNPIIVHAGYYGSTSWNLSLFANEWTRCGVPLFLMISGCLMLSDERTSDVLGFYKKRLPRLLIPLLTWHTVYYFYFALRDGGELSIRNYLGGLFNNGSAYHMWFVYSLLGIYLITPFLKRIVDGCSMKQLGILLLILMFPGTLRPLWNIATGFYVYLFDPLMECYLGYYLFGYMLSKIRITPLLRVLYAIGGVGGFLLGFFGNLKNCSSEGVTYLFNGGYTLNHYLLAGALFLLARDLTENRTAPAWLTKSAAVLSDTAFGVYWIHILLLETFQRLITPDAAPIIPCALNFLAVMVSAELIMFCISKVKPLKKLLM